MEYQKITNLLDKEVGLSASNQPSKFRTRNWVEITDESRETYTSNYIKFETTMLRSNLCDYADAYILVNETITITWDAGPAKGRTEAQLLAARLADDRDEGVAFKNCAPFTKCIRRINNTDIDTAQDIDIAMSMYNLIEYSDNYSKSSGNLWQYYKDKPNDNLVNSKSFKSKVEITEKITVGGNTKNVEIIVPLKYLSNFWRTLEMALINCEVNLLLTWSKDCVITNSTDAGKFAITETKLYVPVVTLSTQDNARLLQQLNLVLKEQLTGTNISQGIKTIAQNRYLYHLVDPIFQGVNRLFILSF